MTITSRLSLADYREPTLKHALETLKFERQETARYLNNAVENTHNYAAQQDLLLQHQSLDMAIRKLEDASA